MNFVKRLPILIIIFYGCATNAQQAQEIATRDVTALSQDLEEFNVGRQLITKQGVLQWREELEFVKFNSGGEIYWENRLVYGLTKSFGVQIRIPVFLHRRVGGVTRHGMTDILVETQWEFYRAPLQAAVLFTGMSFPTGNTTDIPPLGTGSFDLTFALFFAHSSDRWFFSALFGPQITHTRKRNIKRILPSGTPITITKTRDGSMITYELLFGRKYNLCYDTEKTLGLFFELDGLYQFRSKVNGRDVRDSGGNVILFGPFFSFEQRDSWVIQNWIQIPIAQRIFHNRPVTFIARPKTEMVIGISMEGRF